MLVKCFPVGVIQANCYIVTDEASLECAVIDPGADSNLIMQYLEDNHLSCHHILLTHGHFDHTGGVENLQAETGAVIYINKKDVAHGAVEAMYKYPVPSCGANLISEGDIIRVGALSFEVIETPGHSEGGVTFKCENALFTGDTLFRGSIGRTDFPGCNAADIMRSLLKLCALEGDYEVYPGHMEATSLETERRTNYFIRSAMQDS